MTETRAKYDARPAQREIKFRAWAPDFKQMSRPAALDEIMDRDSRVFMFPLDPEETYCRPANLILMQFTGLKDKNGKEIYEGDIVQAVGQPKTRGVIEWLGWGFTLMHYHNPDWSKGTIQVEVIGNIHEKWELVK